MRWRPAMFVVGVVVTVALAEAAFAAYSVRIEGATVPGGENDVVRIDLSFACDPNSDPVVEITAMDRETGAQGTTRPVWRDPQLCDGQMHPAIADVPTGNGAKFRTGDRIQVSVSLNGNQNQSARDDKEVTAT